MEKDTTNAEISKYKSPPGFVLQANFFSDPKTLLLAERCGMGAPLHLLQIWAWCNESSDGYLELAHALVIGRSYGALSDQMQLIVDEAIKLKLLYIDPVRGLFHPTILASRERYFEKSKRYSDAARERENRFRSQQKQNPATTVAQSSNKQGTVPYITFSYINNNSIDPNTGGVGGEAPQPRKIEPEPPPKNELEAAAEKYLEPVDSDAVRKSRVYMTSGRRPCKAYPNVWLSRPEFVQMLEQYTAAGVVRGELKFLLQACESKMLGAKQEGKDPQMKSAYAWLTGFLLEDYLKKRKAKLDVQRSENYLQKAEVRA